MLTLKTILLTWAMAIAIALFSPLALGEEDWDSPLPVETTEQEQKESSDDDATEGDASDVFMAIMKVLLAVL